MAIKIKDANGASKSKNTLNRVHFILDESSSMGSCQISTIDGFNEYIDSLKKDKNGNKFVVSLTKFSGDSIDRVFTDTPVKKVPELTTTTYSPCGMTNLNDAIGDTLSSMEANPLRKKKKYNTLVIIMTDGYENSSREWTRPNVAEFIKRKEDDDGWTVTFLGADIDTHSVSTAYNIKSDNSRSYSKMGMSNTMRGLATATVAYASSATVGQNMCNTLSESVSGLTEEDWMKVDDDVDNADKALKYNRKLDNLQQSFSDSVNLTVTPPQDIGDGKYGIFYTDPITGEFTTKNPNEDADEDIKEDKDNG